MRGSRPKPRGRCCPSGEVIQPLGVQPSRPRTRGDGVSSPGPSPCCSFSPSSRWQSCRPPRARILTSPLRWRPCGPLGGRVPVTRTCWPRRWHVRGSPSQGRGDEMQVADGMQGLGSRTSSACPLGPAWSSVWGRQRDRRKVLVLKRGFPLASVAGRGHQLPPLTGGRRKRHRLWAVAGVRGPLVRPSVLGWSLWAPLSVLIWQK